MHNINLQRVDRMTMAQGLEARTPFLDRDLIDFAQSIPASFKMHVVDEATGKTTEKWILRRACEDLLPDDLIWRQKAQFDEGTGTVDTLDEALSLATGSPKPVDRETEARLYRTILCDQFEDSEMILDNAGAWAEDRVAMSV
jgi:asparagine synthase (glutamine-hydrolysing)